MRGITSQSGNIGYAPVGATVGVYLDGTPITAALGPDNQVSGTLFDIERVEVLKGPQGTLFGEGSQGGTIRYIYKQPDPTEFDAAVNASLALMDESGDLSNRVDAMINLPFGAVAVWDGSVWHASGPRTIPGTRTVLCTPPTNASIPNRSTTTPTCSRTRPM